MNCIPLAPIEFLGVGDVVTGQDSNKYIVCQKDNTLYFEPHPNSLTKKEKYHWKDNNKKPRYDGDNWSELSTTLIPKVSPSKFPAGYVWTTKFSDIIYIVDIEYKGFSRTSSKFWKFIVTCPPCLDAEDYPYEYVSDPFCVSYDEQGNKFWSFCCYCDTETFPRQYPSKVPEGTIRRVSTGNYYQSCRYHDGGAYWKKLP